MNNFETTFFLSMIATVIIMGAWQCWKERQEKKKYDADHQYRLFLHDHEIREDYLRGKSRQEQIQLLREREAALIYRLEDRKKDMRRDYGSDT